MGSQHDDESWSWVRSEHRGDVAASLFKWCQDNIDSLSDDEQLQLHRFLATHARDDELDFNGLTFGDQEQLFALLFAVAGRLNLSVTIDTNGD